ncbi:MAG: hypothetical protein CVT97_00415 [Bacteroidetes bacterium HGW-Bacteroidetes-14]|jgi:hypothetical protein|nr:MAG: hypothetical protein CVT97_00415 [Bacteroidetes bacterium HGW-Bacteroidetes-14]
MNSIIKCLSLFLWFVIASGNLLTAQEREVVIDERIFLPDSKGELTFEKSVASDFSETYPGESSASCLNYLNSVSEIISSWSGLRPPVGAKGRFFAYLSDRISLSLSLSVYVKDGGERFPSGSSSGFTITVNNPGSIAGNPVVGDIIATPARVHEFHGYPVYQTNLGNIAVISPMAESAFIPCTREEYAKACLAREEEMLGVKMAAFSQEDNEENPAEMKAKMDESLKEMEETYKVLLKQDKKLAEDFRKSMEIMKKEVASIDFTPEPGFSKDDAMKAELDPVRKKIMAIKAELAAMSDEERRAQAYLSEDISVQYGQGSGLVKAGVKEGIPLSRPNPQLVKKGRPAHVPQLLTIRWDIGNSSDGSPWGFSGDASGFGLADKIISDLSNEAALWQRIFSQVK